MEFKKYYRQGAVVSGLEVTKEELLELKKNNNFISISLADENNIKEKDDFEIIGTLFGDIYNIVGITDNWAKVNNAVKIVENPDCWLVFRPENHGYKELLDNEYKFGDAIELLKLGYKVARKGWNGKGMWLILQPATPEVEIRDGSIYKKAGLDRVKIDAHIDMHTAQGTMQPGWLASQSDMLSEDWVIIT